MHIRPTIAAGQNKNAPVPKSVSPMINPALYPSRRMIRPAGIASTKYPALESGLNQSRLEPAISNDFMNWRIRTSLRLFGTPQRKNRAVTRKNGKKLPRGKSEGSCRCVAADEISEIAIILFTLMPDRDARIRRPQIDAGR